MAAGHSHYAGRMSSVKCRWMDEAANKAMQTDGASRRR